MQKQIESFKFSSKEYPLIQTLLHAIKDISKTIKNTPLVTLPSTNKFGDQQLNQDIQTDKIIEGHLRSSKYVKGFASQERPQFYPLHQNGEYIVTYDPLDGGTIIDTNFAVGSIFSIWHADQNNLIGTKLNRQANAILATYGPRTTAILYNTQLGKIQQITLYDKDWILSHSNLKISPKTKIFSPGNLRAVTQNKGYQDTVMQWISKQYTLRYTGGLVPDVAQIFIKGNGVFANVESQSYKSKLRVLYEASAVAFLVHKAGGSTVTVGGASLLDYQVKGYDDRIPFGAGSTEEVQMLRKIF